MLKPLNPRVPSKRTAAALRSAMLCLQCLLQLLLLELLHLPRWAHSHLRLLGVLLRCMLLLRMLLRVLLHGLRLHPFLHHLSHGFNLLHNLLSIRVLERGRC